MKQPLLCLLVLCCSISLSAQEKWDLQRCVLHAMTNNISVKQADVQSRMAALRIKLNEAGRYPSLNMNTNAGYNFGRSINPATNQFEDQAIFFNQFSLQSNVNLFNWFSQRYAIEASQLEKKAADATIDRARNDVALNVAVAYLQALLAHGQVEVNVVQIGQTTSQLSNVRKLVNAGSLPELNAAELEAQLARDSANYIGALATYQQNLIQLKALLNLDMAVPFDIEKPDVSTIPVESLGELQPALVYQQALKNLPLQRANQLRYQAAVKNVQVARSSMYPTLSAFAQIASRYSSSFPDQERIRVTPTSKFDTLGMVEITPGNIRPAVRPAFDVFMPNANYTRQLFNIFPSQAIGLNLSIPIFNNRQLRTNWENAKLNAESLKLQADQDNLSLQQDIYRAYNDATNALQRYRAAQKAVEAAEKTFNFAQKRYQVGLLQTIELLTNQNNLYRSRLDALTAQYEYVFRMKLLEFYKGEGLKL